MAHIVSTLSNSDCCTALGKNLNAVTLINEPLDLSRSSGFAFWAMMDKILSEI